MISWEHVATRDSDFRNRDERHPQLKKTEGPKSLCRGFGLNLTLRPAMSCALAIPYALTLETSVPSQFRMLTVWHTLSPFHPTTVTAGILRARTRSVRSFPTLLALNRAAPEFAHYWRAILKDCSDFAAQVNRRLVPRTQPLKREAADQLNDYIGWDC
jgi:hypothetical protein